MEESDRCSIRSLTGPVFLYAVTAMMMLGCGVVPPNEGGDSGAAAGFTVGVIRSRFPAKSDYKTLSIKVLLC